MQNKTQSKKIVNDWTLGGYEGMPIYWPIGGTGGIMFCTKYNIQRLWDQHFWLQCVPIQLLTFMRSVTKIPVKEEPYIVLPIQRDPMLLNPLLLTSWTFSLSKRGFWLLAEAEASRRAAAAGVGRRSELWRQLHCYIHTRLLCYIHLAFTTRCYYF